MGPSCPISKWLRDHPNDCSAARRHVCLVFGVGLIDPAHQAGLA
jgi:hypothetical protein